MRRNEDGLVIVDCPGFGDDDTIFEKSLLENKNMLLQEAPIDGFVLVIKFDKDKCRSFYNVAEHFYKSFGAEGIKSVMLLCIQGNEAMIYENDEFKEILFRSDGYVYLKEKNAGADVQYCLWDNFSEYPRQKIKFQECLNNLQPYTELHFRMAFNMIENKMVSYQEKKDLEKRLNDALSAKPNSSCNLL